MVKDIINAFDHMEFRFLSLIKQWPVTGPPIFLLHVDMLVLLLPFIPGSK